MRNLSALLLVMIAFAAPVVAQDRHDRAFWKQVIAAKYAVPASSSADALSDELSGYLASADPELRDDIAYSILSQWMAVTGAISDAHARQLVDRWIANLRAGVESPGDDRVVLRSFSALCLSTAVARENKTPFLGEDRFRAVLAAALRYFDAERDLRGFDPRLGWVHATAHTADLLKFLARNPQLRPADQADVLSGVARKLSAAPTAFTFGEDERMARALATIVLRQDFDRTAFSSWLDTVGPLAAFPKEVGASSLARQQNARHLLVSMYTLLGLVPDTTSLAAARKELLDAFARAQP